MDDYAMKWRSTLARTAAVLVAGFGVLAVATAAQAHDEHHWKRRGPPFIPPGHVYYSAPIVYAPRPVVVYPAPYVYEREPMYYLAPSPGLNINLNMPLR